MLGKLMAGPADFLVLQMSKSYVLREVVDRHASVSVLEDRELFSKFVDGSASDALDWHYVQLRKKLTNDVKWRYGPERLNAVSKTILAAFLRHVERVSGTYCEIGCGGTNPFGVSTLMYLHGADKTVCFDKVYIDEARVAWSMYDLLVDCIVFEDKWIVSKDVESMYRERARAFDVEALKNGDLSSGMLGTPLNFVSDVFSKVDMEHNTINFLSSWVVLEHVLNLDAALQKMHGWMSSGGLAYHLIDLRDHRYYNNPGQFDQWSFLCDKEQSRPTEEEYFLSTIRTSQLREMVLKSGYEILEWENMQETPANDIRGRLHEKYKNLSDEDLLTTSVSCLLRKK